MIRGVSGQNDLQQPGNSKGERYHRRAGQVQRIDFPFQRLESVGTHYNGNMFTFYIEPL